MNGVNKVILIGYVGNEPQCNNSRGGSLVTSMQIATTQRWKDQQGQDQSKTEWHNLVFFNRLAEVAGEYVKKGDPLYVEGSLQTDKYTDKNGIEKYSTKIIVSQMQMLGSKENGGGNNNQGNNNNRGSNNNQGGRQQNNNQGQYRGNNNQSAPRGQNNNQRTQYSQSRDGAPGGNDFHDDDIPF